MVISGKKIAENILEKLKNEPKPQKFLAAILVGDDAASKSFIKQKEKAAKELGVDFRLFKFSNSTKNDELREEVLKIAQHKTCGGVIVQLPLPEHINRHYILNVIPREKDVDVLGERALGAFYTDRNPVLPPAVATVSEILQATPHDLKASKVAVVGLGFLVGKPISIWLQGKAKEIILFDEGSDFLLLREADIVISGVGKAGTIKPDMLKEEATVIDFGYDVNREQRTENREQGVGDLDVSQITNYQSLSYLPVPGGAGPVLVAKLLENFFTLAKK